MKQHDSILFARRITQVVTNPEDLPIPWPQRQAGPCAKACCPSIVLGAWPNASTSTLPLLPVFQGNQAMAFIPHASTGNSADMVFEPNQITCCG